MEKNSKIVCSSFAWFTSKDEVTNRLTATADYGVSIVESFTPPKQWVPGQTVEKDVYAVNTGSIAAFVKEDVSGKLTVTYENTTNDKPGTANGFTYVKLEEDDIKVAKDGGYLVWNDAGATNGPILNIGDNEDWKPTAEGNYIFRRAVKGVASDDEHPATAAENEKYTLEGFYFKPSDGTEGSKDEYYKILISNYKTGRESVQRTPVAVDADGNLVGIPNIVYVIEKTDTAKPVAFKYEPTGGPNNTPRLVASYTLDAAAAANYDADAVAARHAVEVENAKGEWEFAQYRQNIAEKELELENNLIDERNTLVEAARAYKKAADAQNGTGGTASALTSAASTVNGTTVASAVLATDAPYENRVLKSTDTGYLGTAGGYQNYPTAVNLAIDNFESTYGSGSTGTIGKEATYVSAFNALIGVVTNDTDTTTDDTAFNSAAENAIATLESAYTALDDASEDLYLAYADIQNALTTTATGLDLDSATVQAYKDLLGDANKSGSYMETVDNYKTDVTTLIANVRAYVKARKADNDARSSASGLLNDFIDAIDEYQTNVSGYLDGFDKTSDATSWLENEHTTFAAKNMANHDGNDDYTAAQTWMGNTKLTATSNTAEYLASAIGFDLTAADAAKKAAATTLANTLADTTAYPDTAEVAKTEFHIHGDATKEVLSTELENATSTAKTTYDTLNANPAVVPTAQDLKIYVNLDKDVATNWTMDPTAATLNADMTDDTARQKVSFYLNSILEAGETSAKLIDSVELDATMGNVFRDFTFDLDVDLDSAQIIYDNDQRTIKTDAVVAPAFTLKPTLTTPTDIDTTVTWANT